jgi:hypothetical protein
MPQETRLAEHEVEACVIADAAVHRDRPPPALRDAVESAFVVTLAKAVNVEFFRPIGDGAEVDRHPIRVRLPRGWVDDRVVPDPDPIPTVVEVSLGHGKGLSHFPGAVV